MRHFHREQGYNPDRAGRVHAKTLVQGKPPYWIRACALGLVARFRVTNKWI